MIRCVVPRGSSTAKWLTAANRSYITTSSSSGDQDGSADAKASASEQTVPGDIIGGGEETYNTAGIQDGKTQSKPFKPRDLPISPFMDPETISARQKYRLPKLPPTKTPTLFQQQLAKNPYAQALATSVRECQLTKSSLPKYFLQDFQVMAHPETSEPWWVPMNLRKEYGDAKADGRKEKAQISSYAVSGQDPKPLLQPVEFDEEQNTPSMRGTEASLSPPDQFTPPAKSYKFGPGTYVLSRQALLSGAQNGSSGWGSEFYKSFLSGGLKQPLVGKKVREKSHWRTDMDRFILELMRRRVVEGLGYLTWGKRGYVAGCVDWEDAKMASRQQAAILWTGKMDGEADQQLYLEADEKRELETARYRFAEQLDAYEPPGFATLTIGKDKPHMVPVHNLPMLLGPKHLAELRRQCPIFEKEVLIVKNKRVTVDIQMKLWKLQGYLAFPEPVYDKNFRTAWNASRRGSEEDRDRKSRTWRGGDVKDYQSKHTVRRKEKFDTMDFRSILQGEGPEPQTEGNQGPEK